MERLYLLYKIERGIAQVEAGRVDGPGNGGRALIEVMVEGFLLGQHPQFIAGAGLDLPHAFTREAQLTTDLCQALGVAVEPKAGAENPGLTGFEVF